MTTGSLTVLFEDPFWIGLFEMIDSGCLLILNTNGRRIPAAWSGIKAQTSSRPTTNVAL